MGRVASPVLALWTAECAEYSPCPSGNALHLLLLLCAQEADLRGLCSLAPVPSGFLLAPLGSKGWRWKAGESEVGIPTPWCGNGCVPLRKVTAPVGWPLLRLLPGSDHHNPRCLFRARGGQGALRVGTPGCPTTPMVSLVNTPLFNSPQLPCWTEPCHSCQDSGWTHLLMSSYG